MSTRTRSKSRTKKRGTPVSVPDMAIHLYALKNRVSSERALRELKLCSRAEINEMAQHAEWLSLILGGGERAAAAAAIHGGGLFGSSCGTSSTECWKILEEAGEYPKWYTSSYNWDAEDIKGSASDWQKKDIVALAHQIKAARGME